MSTPDKVVYICGDCNAKIRMSTTIASFQCPKCKNRQDASNLSVYTPTTSGTIPATSAPMALLASSDSLPTANIPTPNPIGPSPEPIVAQPVPQARPIGQAPVIPVAPANVDDTTAPSEESNSDLEESEPTRQSRGPIFVYLLAGIALLATLLGLGVIIGNKLSANKQIPVVETTPPEPVFDPLPWSNASLVLMKPDKTQAAAVQVDKANGHKRYFINAVASGKDTEKARKIAWESKIPIVTSDSPMGWLADVAQKLPEERGSAVLSDGQSQDMDRLLASPTYVVKEKPYVKFVQGKRWRVGFLVSENEEGFTFSELCPNRDLAQNGPVIEQVSWNDVRRETWQKEITKPQARNYIDFVEYSAFEILEKIQLASKNDSTPPRMIVVNVHVDPKQLRAAERAYQDKLEEENRLKEEIRQAERDLLAKHQELEKTNAEIRKASTYSMANAQSGFAVVGNIVLAFLNQKVIDPNHPAVIKVRELQNLLPAATMAKAAVEKEKRYFDEMEQNANQVTRELETKLRSAGMNLLDGTAFNKEREGLANRGAWRPDWEVAKSVGLDEATHFIYGELRGQIRTVMENVALKPKVGEVRLDDPVNQSNGPLRLIGSPTLSLRLYDVKTGEIVWNAEGQKKPIADAWEANHALDKYVLLSGHPVVIEFIKDLRPEMEKPTKTYQGSLPLRLPKISVVRRDPFQNGDMDMDTSPPSRRVPQPGRPNFIKHTAPGIHHRIGFLDDSALLISKQANPYSGLIGAETIDEKALKQKQITTIPFRDLYENEVQDLKLAWIKRIQPLDSLENVPYAHQMRYVVWRLAKYAKPRAGRIIQAESVYQVDAYEPFATDKQLLAVLSNFDAKKGSANQSLIAQLVVQGAGGKSINAVLSTSSRQKPNQGDLALFGVLDRRPVKYAIVLNKLNTIPFLQRDLPKNHPAFNDLQLGAQTLAKQLAEGLVQCGVNVLDLQKLQEALQNGIINPDVASNIGRDVGATHVIYGDFAPVFHNRLRVIDDTRIEVKLTVLDVESAGTTPETITFDYHSGQAKLWVP